MKGSARGNWDPREGQQPFRLNPNGVGDRTTTLRRLLIGADEDVFVNAIKKYHSQCSVQQLSTSVLYHYMCAASFEEPVEIQEKFRWATREMYLQ